MKRFLIFSCAIVALAIMPVQARPFLMEKAGNLNPAGVIEFGPEKASYYYDFTKFKGSDIELTRWGVTVPLTVRYSATNSVEAFVSAPWDYRKVTRENTATGNTLESDVSGLGNTEAAVKYSVVAPDMDISFMGGGVFNTGGDDFPQGTDIKGALLLGRYFNEFSLNASAAFTRTGDYNIKDALDRVREISPGNVLDVGVGAHLYYSSALVLSAELYCSVLGESSVDGAAQDGTSGTRYSALIGGTWYSGPFLYSLGGEFSLGDETYREYDFRIISGITYRI